MCCTFSNSSTIFRIACVVVHLIFKFIGFSIALEAIILLYCIENSNSLFLIRNLLSTLLFFLCRLSAACVNEKKLKNHISFMAMQSFQIDNAINGCGKKTCRMWSRQKCHIRCLRISAYKVYWLEIIVVCVSGFLACFACNSLFAPILQIYRIGFSETAKPFQMQVVNRFQSAIRRGDGTSCSIEQILGIFISRRPMRFFVN